MTPSLKPAWEAREAMAAADALVDAAAARTSRVVSAARVLRPAVDADDAAALREAASKAGPEWLEWLDADAFATLAGRSEFSDGGLRYVGGRCL